MAGKNGSTRPTAGVIASNQLEQPPRELTSEKRMYVVRNQNDREDNARVPHSGPGRRRGMLDRSQQAQLGSLLRAIFSDVADEPVPERFVKLLEALEAREKHRE